MLEDSNFKLEDSNQDSNLMLEDSNIKLEDSNQGSNIMFLGKKLTLWVFKRLNYRGTRLYSMGKYLNCWLKGKAY